MLNHATWYCLCILFFLKIFHLNNTCSFLGLHIIFLIMSFLVQEIRNVGVSLIYFHSFSQVPHWTINSPLFSLYQHSNHLILFYITTQLCPFILNSIPFVYQEHGHKYTAGTKITDLLINKWNNMTKKAEDMFPSWRTSVDLAYVCALDSTSTFKQSYLSNLSSL